MISLIFTIRFTGGHFVAPISQSLGSDVYQIWRDDRTITAAPNAPLDLLYFRYVVYF